jgi:hypothetical protein
MNIEGNAQPLIPEKAIVAFQRRQIWRTDPMSKVKTKSAIVPI